VPACTVTLAVIADGSVSPPVPCRLGRDGEDEHPNGMGEREKRPSADLCAWHTVGELVRDASLGAHQSDQDGPPHVTVTAWWRGPSAVAFASIGRRGGRPASHVSYGRYFDVSEVSADARWSKRHERRRPLAGRLPMSGNTTAGSSLVTAAEWFAGGRRIRYDPASARVVSEEATPGLRVFERVATVGQDEDDDTVWLTLLPGFPDGSFGWARVDRMLGDDLGPRLYVEPVGQGDSDKPRDYRYSTVERADLVEALWRHHAVRRTVVVAFDYTAMALLELLRRQLDRTRTTPAIMAVLAVNGGLFADAHTHPWWTTRVLRTPLGACSTRRFCGRACTRAATVRPERSSPSCGRRSPVETVRRSSTTRRDSSANTAASRNAGILPRSPATWTAGSPSTSAAAKRTPTSTGKSRPPASACPRPRS
jgi:hypothetical protein